MWAFDTHWYQEGCACGNSQRVTPARQEKSTLFISFAWLFKKLTIQHFVLESSPWWRHSENALFSQMLLLYPVSCRYRLNVWFVYLVTLICWSPVCKVDDWNWVWRGILYWCVRFLTVAVPRGGAPTSWRRSTYAPPPTDTRCVFTRSHFAVATVHASTCREKGKYLTLFPLFQFWRNEWPTAVNTWLMTVWDGAHTVPLSRKLSSYTDIFG